MKFVLRPLEVLFVALFLLVCQGVFWTPTSYLNMRETALDASDPSSAVMHVLLILFLLVVSAVYWREMIEAALRGWLLLLLVGMAYLSAFWSDAPDLVVRRATTLAATMLFGVYLVSRFEMPQLVALLVKLNLFAALASFAVMAVAPQLGLSGLEDYPIAWRGIYNSKNVLGAHSASGIILALYALWRGYGPRTFAAALIPADLILLYMSQSKTPVVMMLVVAYVALAASAFNRRDGAGFIAGFVLVVAGLLGAGLLSLGWEEALRVLGRDPTLTGRAAIWRAALHYIDLRPWLGYGYGAFWRTDSIEAQTIWAKFYWLVPHAHNALLEIGLALGIVGMAATMWLWLSAFYRGIRALALPRGRDVVFCLALLVATFVGNITEYDFFRPDTMSWVLFIFLYIHLGREIAAHRVALAAQRRAMRTRPTGPLAYPVPRSAL
jgi:O-antigen ligase